MDEQNKVSKIETLEPQDTGLIKQQGWQLTQIFCLEEGDEEETQKKAMDLAKKLATQFEVAIHEVDDIEFKLLEVYTK
jgi:hypothetical protein